MTLTAHGHHIPGTPRDDETLPDKIAGCGGCQKCQACYWDWRSRKTDTQESSETTGREFQMFNRLVCSLCVPWGNEKPAKTILYGFAVCVEHIVPITKTNGNYEEAWDLERAKREREAAILQGNVG